MVAGTKDVGGTTVKNRLRFILSLGVILLVSACAAYEIDSAISSFGAARSRVQLGDSRLQVIAILEPTQNSLSGKSRKSAESYFKDGVKVDIYYFRSGRQPDGLTTDDEFTPYLFNDDVLVGIGWTVLGGPKTQGQVVQPAPVITQRVIVY